MRVLVILVLLSWARPVQAESAAVFYSYKGDSGRTVYVNRFSMIPPEKRSEARAIDISPGRFKPGVILGKLGKAAQCGNTNDRDWILGQPI